MALDGLYDRLIDERLSAEVAALLEVNHASIETLPAEERSARLAEAFPYGTPNVTAMALLPDEIRNNPVAYPDPEIWKRAEWLQDVGEATLLYDRLFLELKRR